MIFRFSVAQPVGPWFLVRRKSMATVSEDSASARTLIQEMFAGALYKQRQGRIVRQLTCLAIWLTIWLGAWQLYEVLNSGAWGISEWKYFRLAVFAGPTVMVVFGMWFGYRLVNWPRFADFLISVEAEMTKVSWPTKTELYRASMVVIFTMAFLAILLFAYDLVWQAIFDTLGVS
jgi:preprotein translocase subunit SecE